MTMKFRFTDAARARFPGLVQMIEHKHGKIFEAGPLIANLRNVEGIDWEASYLEAAFDFHVGVVPALQGRIKPEIREDVKGEADPTGKGQHEPGAKVDAGKVQPRLIIEGMARALWAVAEIGTFGAVKYTENGWIEVPNGQARYADAQYRHTLKRAMGEPIDPDSEKLHLAHEAWNALAKLDLYLREQEKASATNG